MKILRLVIELRVSFNDLRGDRELVRTLLVQVHTKKPTLYLLFVIFYLLYDRIAGYVTGRARVEANMIAFLNFLTNSHGHTLPLAEFVPTLVFEGQDIVHVDGAFVLYVPIDNICPVILAVVLRRHIAEDEPQQPRNNQNQP